MSNFKKIFGLAGAVMVFTGLAYGQVTCSTPAAVQGNVVVRAEGNTELVSDVSFSCTNNGAAASTVTITDNLSAPPTSKVLASGMTEALVSNAAGTTFYGQGTISGNALSFSISVPNGGTTNFVITNVRVNAASGASSTGTSPAITSQLNITSMGVPVTVQSLAAVTVATPIAGLTGTKVVANSVASPVVCTTYTNSAAFMISVSENFNTAFKTGAPTGAQSNATLGSEFQNNTETGFVPAAGFGSGGNNIATSGTKIKVTFTNIPTAATIYVPLTLTSSGGGTAVLDASEYSSTAATAASTTLSTLGAVTATGGTAVAVYEITGQNPGAQETYTIPVTFSATANTVTPTAAISATVSLAPTSANAPAGTIPTFTPSSTPTTLTGPVFTLCSTTLLFPFVTNQLGFDSGIAISNTSTDPFGTTKGASAQAGTCSLSFYGAGAPTPASVTSPSVPSGTTYTAILSNIAPGFQGYMFAQCNFLYAHGFTFITYGLGGNNGVAEGYLALVLPTGSGTRNAGAAAEVLGQ